jgi:hypothetical protein
MIKSALLSFGCTNRWCTFSIRATVTTHYTLQQEFNMLQGISFVFLILITASRQKLRCSGNEFRWRISPIRQYEVYLKQVHKSCSYHCYLCICRYLARTPSERWNSSLYSWNWWSWPWARAWTDGIRGLLYTHIEWDGAFKTRLCWSAIYLLSIMWIENS